MQFKRRLIILLATFLLVSGISTLLNRASFDPNFSFVDVISGATKHSRKSSSNETEPVTAWSYSAEDIALPDESVYIEEKIVTKQGEFVILRKAELKDDTLILLSDEDNDDYAKAVREAAEYYEERGYTVKIKECSETLMLSLAHAEHFDLLLLREEDAS